MNMKMEVMQTVPETFKAFTLKLTLKFCVKFGLNAIQGYDSYLDRRDHFIPLFTTNRTTI